MKKFSLFLSAILFSVMSFAQTVPTNEELWEAFKPYYITFYGEERADQPITAVATFMTQGEKIFTDATSEYKWLGDYLVMIATEQGFSISSEALWRWHADAFFQANQHTSWPKSADFTEAGKPENWGPYYLAAQGSTTPEVTTVELAYELTNENVLDRMGRRTVYTTDDVLGDVQIILPTFNAETTEYTDASLVVGDATLAATATYAADAENNKEVYTATATSEDGATVYNVTMTVTYPATQEYTFFAMDDAEATVEDWGEEGEPFMVYMVAGAGMLDEEPVEFELMIDQLNNLEGMIGEAFVMGTATSLYEEEGNLAVSGTAMDDAGNTYNIELWVPLAGGEVEIVITEEVDVTLYNLNLDVQGNMAMVTAGGETGVSFWLANLSTLENYYGYYFSDAFSNIWYGDAQLQPYGDGQYSPDGLIVSFISTPDAEGNAVKYNFTLIAGDEPVVVPVIEDAINNLVFDLEAWPMVCYGGPSDAFQIEVYLVLGEDNGNGQFSLTSESSIAVLGQDATFISGYITNVDVYAPSATAVIVAQLQSGEIYEFHIAMAAAPVEAIDIVIEDATVAIDTIPLFGDVVDYALRMTADWTNPADGVTYPVSVEIPVYYPEATEPSSILSTVTIGGWGDTDPWLGFGEGELNVVTVDGVVTAQGTINNPGTGFAANITISGKLPQDPGPGTGLDNVQVEVNTVKTIKNGQLIIVRDGKEYNAQGAVVK